MARPTCDTCGEKVDPDTGYRVLEDDKVVGWFDTEACLAESDSSRVSPGHGYVNVDDQPPLMAVPAPPGYTGPTVDPSAVTS